MKIKRAFLDTEDGQIHYRIGGEGEALILLHQNIKSSDEYRELMPRLIQEKKLVIAVDLLGFGESDKPPRMYYIEDYAKTVTLLLDKLGIKKANVLGHHTGAFVAAEVAAAYPERVNKLVLSCIDYFEEEERKILYNRFSNAFEIREDGSHLTNRWPVRLSYVGSIELNHRCLLDEFRCHGYPPYGPFSIMNYAEKSLERFGLINSQTLILSGTEDIKQLEKLGLAKSENRKLITQTIPNAKKVDIEGGTIYMMNQMSEEIAKIVVDFLDN
ncbi:MAG: alpha/beta hydrolase [Okeania sp. SIO2G4]|uniref:alpha/beta fold hydrolase n=1 Tax=unclassified Okeania TaxID=2634635 RepID=UPI0013B6E640|nr:MULTISPECIES: alpha/beta fold hydrolase [unclassified Okeania]NEP05082.1 alpha/beta hydrolase [Okeania sp. SIO4D6]NEP44414.1 alpha/beta hydrolase [Okeania sp. SIO2H7]NEP72210.1 alpha/beta hydrolase [Okeania sp. SIO2G5]NEP94673.1 alpha/beta hydrolase [Okeania sp. SIO2F5]NEQ90824.1 alpha/beta hydrolase [Okeania sp. SIO2G4]